MLCLREYSETRSERNMRIDTLVATGVFSLPSIGSRESATPPCLPMLTGSFCQADRRRASIWRFNGSTAVISRYSTVFKFFDLAVEVTFCSLYLHPFSLTMSFTLQNSQNKKHTLYFLVRFYSHFCKLFSETNDESL